MLLFWYSLMTIVRYNRVKGYKSLKKEVKKNEKKYICGFTYFSLHPFFKCFFCPKNSNLEKGVEPLFHLTFYVKDSAEKETPIVLSVLSPDYFTLMDTGFLNRNVIYFKGFLFDYCCNQMKVHTNTMWNLSLKKRPSCSAIGSDDWK